MICDICGKEGPPYRSKYRVLFGKRIYFCSQECKTKWWDDGKGYDYYARRNGPDWFDCFHSYFGK